MSAPATKQPLAPPSRERGPGTTSTGPDGGANAPRGGALRTQLKASSYADGERLLSAGPSDGGDPVQLQGGGPATSRAPTPPTPRPNAGVGPSADKATQQKAAPGIEVSEKCMTDQTSASEGADLETLIATIASKYKYLLLLQRDGVLAAGNVLKTPEPPTLLASLIDLAGSFALVSVAGWAGGYVKGRVAAYLKGRSGLTPGRAEASATAVASLMKEAVTDIVAGSWDAVVEPRATTRADPLQAFVEMQQSTLTRATSITEAHFLNHGARALRAGEEAQAAAEAQLQALNELLCGPVEQRQRDATLDAWVRYVAAREQTQDDEEPKPYSPEEVSPSKSNDGVLEVHVDAGSPLTGGVRLRELTIPGVNPAVIDTYKARGSVGEIDVPKVVKLHGTYFPHEARSGGPKSMVGFPFLASMLRDSSGGVRLELDGPGRPWLKLFFHGNGPERGSSIRDEAFLASLPDAYIEKGARKLYHHVMQLRP